MQIPNGQKERNQMKAEFQIVIPQPRPIPVCLFKYPFLFVHLSIKRLLTHAPQALCVNARLCLCCLFLWGFVTELMSL